MKNCRLVGAGGVDGSVPRYLIGLLPVGASSGFPIKTLAINVVGTFAIGLISALSEKYAGFPPSVVLMLKAGLCGGFTTFSTFAFETGTLMRGGLCRAEHHPRHGGGICRRSDSISPAVRWISQRPHPREERL